MVSFPLPDNFFTAGKGLTDGSLANIINTLESTSLYMNDVAVVEKLSDLPSPDSGVITLKENTVYMVSGMVDIGVNRIVASIGSSLVGHVFRRDGLQRTGTPTGSLLTVPTGVDAFCVHSMYLKTPAGAGDIFDISNANADINACRCLIEGDIGSITASVLRMNHTYCEDYNNGLQIANIGILEILGCSFNQAAGGTGSAIELTGSIYSYAALMMSSFVVQPTGIGVQGLANNANLPGNARATIQSCLFAGSTTPLSGISTDDVKWAMVSSSGIENSVVVGSMEMYNNSTSTSTSGTTWTKVLGTTVSLTNRRFAHVTNRLTNLSLSDKTFRLAIEVTARSSVNNTPAEFGISINGSDPARSAPLELYNNKDNVVNFFTVSGLMVEGDYVEIWCRDTAGGGSNITASSVRMLISALASGI